MKIFINALALRAGGGQTHLFNILEHLPNDPENTFYLLAPENFKEPQTSQLVRFRPLGFEILDRPLVRFFWERFVLPLFLKKMKIDVLFAPGGLILGKVPEGCKIVTACQNMMPFDHKQRAKYPYGYMRLRTYLLEGSFLKSFARSDLVVFISNFAKEKVSGLMKPGAIKNYIVAPSGINRLFVKKPGQLRPKPQAAPDSYLLYVSTIDVYKAQLEVIRGFSIYLQRHPIAQEKLLLVGSEYRPYANQVRELVAELGLSERVQLTGPLLLAELPAWYEHALVNIFASECENCPNILLEAMAAGRPMLVSDIEPMPEFGGDAVVYFDQTNPEDFAAKLAATVPASYNFEILNEKAMAQAAKFDWSVAGDQIWSAILRLA